MLHGDNSGIIEGGKLIFTELRVWKGWYRRTSLIRLMYYRVVYLLN